MKVENWEDLRFFCTSPSKAGLRVPLRRRGSGADHWAADAGLERATGRALFRQGADGIRARHGRQILLDRVEGMQEQRRTSSIGKRRCIRCRSYGLLSDNTVSCFTATSLRHLWTPDDAFRVCFKTTEAAIDLTHRDVDIGLAPERPQLGNVAVRPFRRRRLCALLRPRF